jgi:hypothetical protein
MTEKYQRPPYNGTLGEAARQEDQKVVAEDQLSKKRGEVRFLATDRQKRKEFVDNLCS